MTRSAARAMLATAAAFTTLTLAAVVVAVLVPVEEVRAPFVPLAKLEALPQGLPVLVTSTELAGLDLKAARIREHGSNFGRPRGSVKALPVFLVRDGDEVRGFIGIDPRNGCDVDLLPARTLPWGSFPTQLYDHCHGSIYDFSGRHIGGPSPWNLDEVVLTVHDGRVLASTSAVVAGRWVIGGP